MKKIVEFFVGIPCSGKSTHLHENYNQNEIYIISMDDIKYTYADKMKLGYEEFFERPTESEIEMNTVSDKYGAITENGQWEKLEIANTAMRKDFSSMVRRSHNALEEGKRVIIDMTNLTKKDRKNAMKWYKDIDDVKFEATVFQFEDNLDLIMEQNKKRGQEENKFIADFVIPMMVKRFQPIEMDEGINEIKFIDGLKGLKEEMALEQKEKVKAKRSSLPRKKIR